MLLKIRWGSLRTKIIAWSFAPSAAILLSVAFLTFFAFHNDRYKEALFFLLLVALVAPNMIIGMGVNRVVRPIAELTRAAQEVARGNFGLTIEAETGDEVEELAKQFNIMSGQLREAYTHLEQRVADRTKELDTLNTLAALLSSSLDLDKILRDALGEVMTRMDVQAGAIYLMDTESKALRLYTQNGFRDAWFEPQAYTTQAEGLWGQALASNQAVILEAEKAEQPLAQLMETAGVTVVVSAPILHQDQDLGVMSLAAKKKRTFQPQEQDLLLAIGQQMGMAIENARLYKQAQQEIAERTRVEEELRCANQVAAQHNRELTLLNGVIAAATSDMDVIEILEVVCRELVQGFGVTRAAAALLEEDGESLRVVAESMPEGDISALGVIIPVENNPATLYVIKHKSPLAMSDAQNDILLAPIRTILRERGVLSLVILPLMVQGEVVGTIGLDALEKREYSPEELKLASSAAAAVSQALERAWIAKQKATRARVRG